MRMKLIKRLLFRPARRLGRTLFNLFIFDLASTIYGYSKGWFREPKTKPLNEKEEDTGTDLDWQGTKERRW